MKYKNALLALFVFAGAISLNWSLKQQEPKVNISLTVTEANTVIKALQTLPYSEVAGLINNITSQANKQLNLPDTSKIKNKKP